MLGGGFIHSPPKMVEYLTVTEKQEEQWFQLREETTYFTVNNFHFYQFLDQTMRKL
jgi:hypothetical protein